MQLGLVQGGAVQATVGGDDPAPGLTQPPARKLLPGRAVQQVQVIDQQQCGVADAQLGQGLARASGALCSS